jgi:hypothetical protein
MLAKDIGFLVQKQLEMGSKMDPDFRAESSSEMQLDFTY